MTNRKSTKEQTMIYKTLHKRLRDTNPTKLERRKPKDDKNKSLFETRYFGASASSSPLMGPSVVTSEVPFRRLPSVYLQR